MKVLEAYDLTKIDPWFLYQIRDLVQFSDELASYGTLMLQGREGPHLPEMLRQAKEYGFSDVQLAHLWGLQEDKIRQLRIDYDIRPSEQVGGYLRC